MNTRKLLTYYGIFGCWAKFIPGTFGHILFGVWLAMVLFWMFVNAGGIVTYLINKRAVSKEAARAMNPDDIKLWYVYNLMAICSYLVCYEIWVALAFALTSCLFAYITEQQIKKVNKK